jgi:hypothetical protein
LHATAAQEVTMLDRSFVRSLACGLAGALTLTAFHEGARKMTRSAPRMDRVGREGVARLFRGAGRDVPSKAALHKMALFGDVAGNAMYYARVAQGPVDDAWRRGALLGASAGLAAVAVPKAMNLEPGAPGRKPGTALMTVAWYTLGGLAAAAAYRLFGGRDRDALPV